ncbi:MAG: tape measure protein [Betaproteobacteria bacterium]|nr:tape measure protein [Betaproteobacteria bacterium]
MADLVVGIRINADGSAATAEIVKTRDALNQFGQSSDTARRQLEQKNAALQLVSQQFSFAKTALLGYIGAQALLRGAREWIETADSLTLVNARLKQASQSVAEFTGLQRGLYESAQRLGVSYSELAASTSRLEPAVRALGGGAKEAAKLAEIVIATARVQGATTAEAASSAQQFAQALGSGVLQGDELKSILENNQKLARVLAEGLGVSVGQLKKLGEEGKLTSDVVANAALKSYSRIQADVAQIPETFAASLTRLKNASEQAVDLINRQYGVTAILSGAINELVKAMDAVRESNKSGTKSAADNAEAIRILAFEAARLIDSFRVLLGVASLALSTLHTLGIQILGIGEILVGLGRIIIGAVTDWSQFRKGITQISDAVKVMSLDLQVLGGKTRELFEMKFLSAAVYNSKELAGANKSVADTQETLAAKSAAANERWREATRDLKTLSTVQAEYNDQLSKLNAAYAQRSAAAANAYKTDAAQAAAQAAVDRQYGEAKLALDKKLAKSKDDLAQQNQVSFEKQIRLAEVAAEAQIKAAQFVSQQEKLALDESQNYLEFAQRAGIISEQEYLTRRADLREADSVREINELKTNLSIQQRLLDEARQKASIARGKEGIASAQINVADIDKKRLETANQLIAAEQKLGNVQLANIRELLAADKARAAALTQLQRAQEDSLQHIQDQVAALEFETTMIGKSELAQRRLTEARRIDLQVQQLKVQLARLEADALTRADPLDSQRIANLRESISALETSKTRVDELIVKQDQLNQTTQVYAEFWRNLDDAAFDAFKTIVTGSGNAIDSLKKLGNYLKDQLLRYLYQITAQKFIVQVFGQFSGSSTGSTVGNLFGSLFGGSGGDSGGGSGIGSLLSSVGSLFTSSGSSSGGLFGSLVGSSTLSEGGALGAAGSTAGTTAGTASGAAGGAAGSGTSAFAGLGTAALIAYVSYLGGGAIGKALSKNPNDSGSKGGSIGAVSGAAVGSYFGPIGSFVGAIIGAIVGALSADRGGPKNGGSFIGNYDKSGSLTSIGTRDLFGVHNQDEAVKEITSGLSGTFFEVLKQLGGSVSSASFGLGFDSDPRGTAQNRIKALASVNGQSVFSEIDREVGRDMQRLPIEIGTSANRALLAALQAAFKDVQNPVADILRSVNATTATTEAVDALIKKAYELKLFMDVLKQTALVGFSYEILEKFQRQGETIEQTLSRLGTAVGGFKDTFTSDDDKRKNALNAFNQLATDLGVKLPATAEGFRDMVLGLNLADDAQRRIFSVLIDSKDAAKVYYDEQARLAQAQRQAADEFRNQFTGDDERRSQAVGEFTQLIRRLGVALPDTAEGFRDMVLGLDQTDAAQKSLYELFLNSKDAARAYYDEQAKLTQAQAQAAEQLSQANASIDATIQGIRSKNPSFDQVGYAKREVARIGDLYASSASVEQRLRLGGQLSTAINNRFGLETDALKKQFDARRQANSQAQQHIMQAIEAEKNAKIESARAGAQAAQALADALNRIKQDNDALKLGDASPLTNAQRLTEARRQYDGILTRARGGDLEAVGQYTGIRSELLELAQTYYSSASAEYGDLFRQLLGDGEALAAAGGARIDYSAYEREAIDTATGTLQTSAELVRLQTEAAGLDAEFQAQYEALEQAAIAELEAIKEANERAAQEQQARLDALHREAVRQANDVAEIKGLLVEIIGKQTPPIVLDDDTIKAVVSGITAGVARTQEGIRG